MSNEEKVESQVQVAEAPVDKNLQYIQQDCMTKDEFLQMVKDGKFGLGGAIKDAPTWTKGANRKLLVTFSFPDGAQDKKVPVPFKASSYDGKTYFNKKSVIYFQQRMVKHTSEDLNGFVMTT